MVTSRLQTDIAAAELESSENRMFLRVYIEDVSPPFTEKQMLKSLDEIDSWCETRTSADIGLSIGKLTMDLFRTILASRLLNRVSSLNLSADPDDGLALGPECAEYLAQASDLSNIRNLLLCSQELQDEGAVAIADSTNWTNLESLYLRYNEFTIDGIQALVLSKNFPSLRELELEGNDLEDDAVDILVDSELCSRLERITVTVDDLSDEALDRLHDFFGERITL